MYSQALVSLVSLLPLLPLIAGANPEPFWTLSHRSLVNTRFDPIINPGGISSHQHAIVGASNFGPQYDYKESLDSECVSGNMAIDKSNYWAPSLYRKDGTGFREVPLEYVFTYYFVRRQENEPIHEFPPGFRMMAGSATRTSYDENDRAQKAISYECLYKGKPRTYGFPTENCPGSLRAQAFFPNCWDGKNNWLAGNKHVAYPSEGEFDGGGKCPSTHPKRIVSLFYEFHYKDDYEYKAGARVWANGDDKGYSFHADFTNGWPEGTFTDILSYGSQCAVEFSLEKCPALAPHMQKDGQCTYKGQIVDEATGKNAIIPALPGNNPLWGSNGPNPAAGYTEKGMLVNIGNNGTKIAPPGPGKQYDQINAGTIHIAMVKGDKPYTGATSIAGDGATGGVSGGGSASNTAIVDGDDSMSTSISGLSAAPTTLAPKSTSKSATRSAASSKSTIGGPVLVADASSSASSTSSGGKTRPTEGKTCLRSRRRHL